MFAIFKKPTKQELALKRAQERKAKQAQEKANQAKYAYNWDNLNTDVKAN